MRLYFDNWKHSNLVTDKTSLLDKHKAIDLLNQLEEKNITFAKKLLTACWYSRIIFPPCNLITSPKLATCFTPSVVPDRSRQGQVTRAQEAEENYLIKRELATVKQQNEETSAQLEQAQSSIRQLKQQQQPAVRTVHRQRPLLDVPEPAAQRKRGYTVQWRKHSENILSAVLAESGIASQL